MRKSLRYSPLIALLAIFALPQPCLACYCIPPPTPAEGLTKADAVFRGRVIATPSWPPLSGYVRRDIAFRVETSWKGQVAPEVLVVDGWGAATSTCTYQLESGVEYLVYARADREGTLSVEVCNRTRPVSEAADDLRALGPGTPIGDSATPSSPQTGGSVGTLLPPIGAGLLGTLASAGLALRSRRVWRALGERDRPTGD